MTVKNEKTIQKCTRKNWDFSKFLRKADEEENISLQMSCMRHMPPEQKVVRGDSPYVKRQTFQQRKSKNISERCNYCGLSGVHIKGRGCPAYHKRCYKCNKRDHFAVVCRTKQNIKERIYTNHRIKPETSIFKKTELESRSKEESDYTIPIKSVGHFTMRKVSHREETRGIFQKRDMHSARLQGHEGKNHLVKRLNVEHIEKRVRTSKREKSYSEHSLNDDKTAVHCKSHERSSREDGIRLKIEELKEVVKKWENRYRYSERTVSSIKQKSRVNQNKTMHIQPNMNTKCVKEKRKA